MWPPSICHCARMAPLRGPMPSSPFWTAMAKLSTRLPSVLTGRGSRTTPASNQTTIIGAICAVIGAGAFVTIFGTGATVKPLGFVEFPFAVFAGAVIGGALGAALSLSRQSTTPLFWGLSVTFIEFIRGVPLISLLFFGDTMLLFFFPKGFDPPSQVTRAMIVVTAFSAAYIAEIVRGGLQAVDKGQIEAAQAVGLPFGKVQRLIVLPQALRAVIPAMVGQFISLWKDTSLLGFISLTEILAVSRAANSQPAFQGRGLQDLTFMFVGLIFWVVSYTMSRESQRLEKKLRVAER
jgi:general L-amino acid transport system permease protein